MARERRRRAEPRDPEARRDSASRPTTHPRAHARTSSDFHEHAHAERDRRRATDGPHRDQPSDGVEHLSRRHRVSWLVGGEAVTIQNAYEHARSLALSRMQQEAALLGATSRPRREVSSSRVRVGGRSDRVVRGRNRRAHGRCPAAAATDPHVARARRALEAPPRRVLADGHRRSGARFGSSLTRTVSAKALVGRKSSPRTRALHKARVTTRRNAFARPHITSVRHGVVGVRVTRTARDREYESGGQHIAFRLEPRHHGHVRRAARRRACCTFTSEPRRRFARSPTHTLHTRLKKNGELPTSANATPTAPASTRTSASRACAARRAKRDFSRATSR